MDVAAWRTWWKRVGENELRAVVMESWDPIGVSFAPEAHDEYDAYLGRIAVRLRDGISDAELARFLTDLATGFGLGPRPEADHEAARAIRRWYDGSTSRYSDIAKPS